MFGWVLPFAFLFLLWNWMDKCMGSGARGFHNIGGNRVRIHPEGGNKTTFKDVSGAEDAKQELSESIDFLKKVRFYSTSWRAHAQLGFSDG